jgi:hypothetical protein
MDTPGDGDGSSSDDGLIAKVIPLRRRDAGHAWERSYDPPGSDIFEPPDDPEPLAEYSVWETPTAQLVRREPPRRPALAVGAWSRFPHEARRHRLLTVVAVLGAVGLTVIALGVLPLGHGGRAPAAVGQLDSPAGLGQTLGASATSRVTPAPERARSQRRARAHTAAAKTHRHRATSQTLPADHVSPSASANVTVAYSSPPPASPTSTPTSNGSEAEPSAVAAEREFGFER